MFKDWEVGKTYKTRGGWDAKLLSNAGVMDEPLIVKHFYPHDEPDVEFHCEDGKYYSKSEDKHDLIPPAKSIYVVEDHNGHPWCSYADKAKAIIHYGKKSGQYKPIYRYVQKEEVTE